MAMEVSAVSMMSSCENKKLNDEAHIFQTYKKPPSRLKGRGRGKAGEGLNGFKFKL